MSTIDNLNWRYATKRYDASKPLTQEQRELLMEALRLAPSSFGLQPWKFVHVTTPALREQLKAAAWNQPQLTEASDVFVLCAVTNMDEKWVDRFVAETAKVRGVPVESLNDMKQMLVGAVMGRTPEQRTQWNARQVYIALGVALATAAENHIDASPMEGFDTKKFDEILGLEKLGLTSCVILAAGFRSPDDPYLKFGKVRFPRNEVFIEM